MRAALAPLFVIVLFSSGCHVVERSKQCSALAALMSDAAPEINSTKITENPSAKTLRKKARLFGQLADGMQAQTVRAPDVDKERKSLVDDLRTLEKHLKDAANAVEEQKKFEKRQEDVRARAKKQVAEAQLKAEANEADTAKLAPQNEAKKKLAGKVVGVPVPTKAKRPSKKKARPVAPRSTVHSRRYGRLKRSMESGVSTMKAARKRLEKACR